MIKVITGLKNGDLERAMVSKLEGFRSRPGKDFSKAVKMALKKIPFQAHEGVCYGRIANYGPSSSPMGRLAQALMLVSSAAGTDCSSKHCAYLIGE